MRGPARSRRAFRLQVAAWRLALVAVILGAWAWYAGPGGVSPFVLPAPGDVVDELRTLLTRGQTWENVRVTAYEVLVAFTISAGVGFSIGALAARSTRVRERVTPLLLGGYMAPTILFFPILLLVFGYGSSSKIAFGVANSVFQAALSTVKALSTVDVHLMRVARSLGASRRQMLWSVKLPAAMPALMAGAQQVAALSMLAVIAGEILASQKGIGRLLADSVSLLRTERVYAYILISIAVIGTYQWLVSLLDYPYRRRMLTGKREALGGGGL